MAFTWWLYPTRRFDLDGRRYALRARARTDGLVTHLDRDGTRMSSDRTPLVGPEAVRNHEHRVALPDGRTLDLEAGYLGAWSLGIHARIDGASVHESHPGRTLAFPEAYREQTVGMSSLSGELKKNWNDGLKEGAASTGWTQERWRANRLPLATSPVACCSSCWQRRSA